MSAFTVDFQNQPGELARLCELMAARQVNLVVCGITRGGTGTVAFTADNEDAARSALTEAGIEFQERPTLTVRMDNVPGAGAATFRALADANTNVELLLPVRVSDDEFQAVICAENLEEARAALGEQVVDR